MATTIVTAVPTLSPSGRLVELGGHFCRFATRYQEPSKTARAYLEIHMYIKATSIGVRSIVGAFALAAAFLAGDAAARVFDVKVAIHVSTQGIDLKQPAGAQELYRRIQHAADVACTYGDRIDLKPAENFDNCHEEALGNTVRSVNAPLLTEIYLQTHTIQQASTYGIRVPKQVASN